MRSNFSVKTIVLMAVCIGLTIPLAAQLAVDSAKPYVYIEFDHTGKVQQEKQAEQSLWLRLVNNSTLPLRVRTFSKGKEGNEVGINYSVVLTPEGALRYFKTQGKVPSGHVQDVSSSEVIPVGGSLMFTVPPMDVGEYWYLDTTFHFELPRPMGGSDPSLHVTFSQSQIP